MAACGRVVLDCQRRWAASGTTVLAAALDGGVAEDWRHYPAEDVYDAATHAQYFYHAHPPAERGAAEAGHFHTFLRARGMPAGVRPLVLPELAIPDNPAAPALPPVPSAPQSAAGEDGEPWSHLAAIAIGPTGWATRLFTTNRWVTGETWYAAADVALMLDRFAVGTAAPARPLDRWITAMLGLFRPQIAALLRARDAAVMGWRQRRRGKVHVFEDRRLEVTASCEIDVLGQMGQIEAALRELA